MFDASHPFQERRFRKEVYFNTNQVQGKAHGKQPRQTLYGPHDGNPEYCEANTPFLPVSPIDETLKTRFEVAPNMTCQEGHVEKGSRKNWLADS